MLGRRLLPLLIISGLSILTIIALIRNLSWRSIGLGEEDGPTEEQIKSGKDILPDLRAGKGDLRAGELPSIDIDPHAWKVGTGAFKEPKVDAKSPYPVGKTKPAGSNYTKCLVIPKMRDEDSKWIEDELGDMLHSGMLTTAIYAMDDMTAPLHPLKNKGHEVMAYLSYLIEFYERLPDVAIFMHSHRFAWHNNEILDKDSSLMIRHLSPERVTREGYMNLRCHWRPGCPDWLHPGAIERDYWKQEEHILANSWTELFPGESIPTILAQPCCAQFAVSRERVVAIPKQKFVWLKDWLLRTDLEDYLSGRIFEYIWQYIFTSSPVHCPSMSACYCDGYGLCFGDAEKFDYWFELRYHLNEHKEELRVWNEKADAVALAHEQAQGGKMEGWEDVEVPEVGRDEWLRKEIERIQKDMDGRRDAAFEMGKDPEQRAREAGREWREGDGF